MSKATKCDRCGTCFCPNDILDKQTAHFSDLMIVANHQAALPEYTMRIDRIDLCPDCTKSFHKFMDNFNKMSCSDIIIFKGGQQYERVAERSID